MPSPAARSIIVVDAEDRENEGDFICAAEKATPELVNFILSGRGQFCTPLLPETARRLELAPVVETNTAPLGTGFLTPIDHRTGKTGITADERARTVRAMADPASTAGDFVRPGHVHPLLAKEGGVLRRAGHTEAAVDLCRMAGLAPVGVLCEILDDRGERATRDQLQAIADEAQPEDHLDRAAHRPSPRERKARQPHRAGQPADRRTTASSRSSPTK